MGRGRSTQRRCFSEPQGWVRGLGEGGLSCSCFAWCVLSGSLLGSVRAKWDYNVTYHPQGSGAPHLWLRTQPAWRCLDETLSVWWW